MINSSSKNVKNLVFLASMHIRGQEIETGTVEPAERPTSFPLDSRASSEIENETRKHAVGNVPKAKSKRLDDNSVGCVRDARSLFPRHFCPYDLDLQNDGYEKDIIDFIPGRRISFSQFKLKFFFEQRDGIQYLCSTEGKRSEDGIVTYALIQCPYKVGKSGPACTCHARYRYLSPSPPGFSWFHSSNKYNPMFELKGFDENHTCSGEQSLYKPARKGRILWPADTLLQVRELESAQNSIPNIVQGFGFECGTPQFPIVCKQLYDHTAI